MRNLLVTILFALTVCIPSMGVPTIDLTTLGSHGTINGALFYQSDPQSTGTGLIDSFVRIQGKVEEKGYNTDGTLEFNTKAGSFTHSLLLSAVPLVTINSVNYREFLLDIDESVDKFLSLDELKIHLEATGDLSTYPTNFSSPIYDLDFGGDNWIKLDYSLNSGSGSGDMFAYIPNSLFTGGNQYVYLYSKFGVNCPADDGPEEWAVRESTYIIPTPGAVLLGSIGICLVGWLRRLKTLQ